MAHMAGPQPPQWAAQRLKQQPFLTQQCTHPATPQQHATAARRQPQEQAPTSSRNGKLVCCALRHGLSGAQSACSGVCGRWLCCSSASAQCTLRVRWCVCEVDCCCELLQGSPELCAPESAPMGVCGRGGVRIGVGQGLWQRACCHASAAQRWRSHAAACAGAQPAARHGEQPRRRLRAGRQCQKPQLAACPSLSGLQAASERPGGSHRACGGASPVVGAHALWASRAPAPPVLTMQLKLHVLPDGCCWGSVFAATSRPSVQPAPPSCRLSCPSAQERVRPEAARPIQSMQRETSLSELWGPRRAGGVVGGCEKGQGHAATPSGLSPARVLRHPHASAQASVCPFGGAGRAVHVVNKAVRRGRRPGGTPEATPPGDHARRPAAPRQAFQPCSRNGRCEREHPENTTKLRVESQSGG